jgi:hypothetical protein
MKMATLFFPSLKSSLKRLAGLKARLSTLISSEIDSSSGKLSQALMSTLAEVLEENAKLKEELRLRDLYDNRSYDV